MHRRSLAISVTMCALLFVFIQPGVLSKPALQDDYVGSQTCQMCHADDHAKFSSTRMGKLMLTKPRTPTEAKGCEACHGPGRVHVDAGGDPSAILRFGEHSNIPKNVQEEQCMQCHDKGTRSFWKGSTHESRGLTCVTCHKVKEGKTVAARFLQPLTENTKFTQQSEAEVCFQCHEMRRAQLQRSSHMPSREGKVTCSSCHNAHGGPNPSQLTEATVNENCVKCHTERRGPFLWEHAPVMESCTTCHESHGSSNPQLLKVRTPRLCQNCHNEARHPTTPQLATSRNAFNRSCTNCHSQIHGSNHPSGVRFMR